jgi:hypothetical protein
MALTNKLGFNTPLCVIIALWLFFSLSVFCLLTQFGVHTTHCLHKQNVFSKELQGNST